MAYWKVAEFDNDECLYRDTEKIMGIFINKKTKLISCVKCCKVFKSIVILKRHLKSKTHIDLVCQDKNDTEIKTYMESLENLDYYFDSLKILIPSMFDASSQTSSIHTLPNIQEYNSGILIPGLLYCAGYSDVYSENDQGLGFRV